MNSLGAFFSAVASVFGFLTQRDAARHSPEALRAAAAEERRREKDLASERVGEGNLPEVRRLVAE